MMHNEIKKQFFVVIVFLSHIIYPSDSTKNLYLQTNSEILKKVCLENPTLQDQHLITACQLLEKKGLPLQAAIDVIWNAILSVDIITEILPRYHQTFTTFGYIALIHQCAQMTDNLQKLQQKKDLLEFLETYQETFNKLNSIIKYSAPAEQKYLSLCTTKNDEEQASSDATHKKLYFSMYGFNWLNENSWALGTGPRINQLHTLAWYTLPLLTASFFHKQYTVAKKHELLSDKKPDLQQQITLEETLQQKLTEEVNVLTTSLLPASTENTQPESITTEQQQTIPITQQDLLKELSAKQAHIKESASKVASLKKEIELLQQAVDHHPFLPKRACDDITPKEITKKDIATLQSQLTKLLPKAQEESKKNPIEKYTYNHTNYTCDRTITGYKYEKEIHLTQKLLDAVPHDNPQELMEYYTTLTQSYLLLRDFTNTTPLVEKISMSIVGNFINKLSIHEATFALQNSVSYLQALIKHSCLDSITNIPQLLYDGVAYTPTAFKHAYKGICELHNNVTESLIKYGYKDTDTSTKLLAASGTGLACTAAASVAALYPYMLYRRYHATKELFDLIYEKQKELVEIGHLIKSMYKVQAIIKKDSALRVLMPEGKMLARLFSSTTSKTSKDLKNLINALLSSSFQKGQCYYLTQQGKILATHHLLMRIKEQLVPYLQAYGHIDAYLSTYKLYKEYQHHPNARICIATFIDQENPLISIQGLWHPLIDANKVVTNNLSLGTKPQNANFVITGPNAGGKTTSLMALIINVIMAQAYGISLSSKFTLTPFSKIHSYLDITTNLLAGESLFKAEVNRSKQLKESILSCQPGQKAFTIIDEIFSGTNPDVASKVGFTFADQIGKIPHSMAIITTHFPRLTDLEAETGRYQNYKVADAHIAQDGTITYPFKLEKGKSTQNIAEHMLEQEGII